MNADFKELLRIFNENEVKYLIVGGHAVMKYSEPRFTKDLDVWVEATLENASKVFQSLKSFGAPLADLTESDFTGDGFYQMGRPPVRVDILMSIDGIHFSEAWPNRIKADLDGVPVHVIGFNELIINKRSTGRLQDLLDIQHMILSQETTNESDKGKDI